MVNGGMELMEGDCLSTDTDTYIARQHRIWDIGGPRDRQAGGAPHRQVSWLTSLTGARGLKNGRTRSLGTSGNGLPIRLVTGRFK